MKIIYFFFKVGSLQHSHQKKRQWDIWSSKSSFPFRNFFCFFSIEGQLGVLSPSILIPVFFAPIHWFVNLPIQTLPHFSKASSSPSPHHSFGWGLIVFQMIHSVYVNFGPTQSFWWFRCKESTCQCRKHKRLRLDPWVRKILWRRKWRLNTPAFLPRKSQAQRNLVGYSPWGHRSITHELMTSQQ